MVYLHVTRHLENQVKAGDYMKRYITKFNLKELEKIKTDVVIVGAGIAGLYTALMLPENLNITILSKSSYKETNSYRAQGGIACVFNEKNDSIQNHYIDTLICGKKENNIEAVKTLVKEGKYNVGKLIEFGVPFNKDKNGNYSLGKEGAHSANRILHCGDYTGKSIMETLYEKVKSKNNIILNENAFAIDLITNGNNCIGVLFEENNKQKICQGHKTVIATGGIGRVFNNTTNSKVSTGDGISMVKRAGGSLRNMSYIQYHPTVFFDTKKTNKIFLISEAVRGEGATIRNINGKRIMKKAHPLKDLAPRDIVSKEIFKELEKGKAGHVFLDATMHSKEDLEVRFPYIYRKCKENGYDLSQDYIPIIPMMHYFMGGIDVNINGKTNLRNLYACGECAHTGVHGANRLASNSLLEAIVFGNKIALHISKSINSQIERDNFEIDDISNDKTYKVSEKQVIKFGNELNKFFNSSVKQSNIENLRKELEKTSYSIVENSTKEDIEYINMQMIIEEIMKALLQEEKIYAFGAAN